MYRVPVEGERVNKLFYNCMYKQGLTTETPDDAALREMINMKFVNTAKDYTRYIEALFALGAKAGQKLFDFGASWGYGSWQLREAGFDVEASEIGRRRREFAAQKLGIVIVEDPRQPDYLEKRRGTFDIFFSCHVLEHVPRPRSVWALARELLRPGGLFIAITPNGSTEARRANPEWRRLWGLVHPNLLDPDYYLTSFPAPARLVASLPLEKPSPLSCQEGDRVLRVDGPELLFAARV